MKSKIAALRLDECPISPPNLSKFGARPSSVLSVIRVSFIEGKYGHSQVHTSKTIKLCVETC